MSTLHLPNLRSHYASVVRHVRMGDVVPSRDGDTREVLDLTLIVDDPTDVLPVGINRKLNPKIAALEFLQLVGGVQVPQLLVKAAPHFARFQDGEAYHGAYGPRLAAQLPAVVRRLEKDPGTRQAVLQIWDPLHDLLVENRKDYPCTLTLQFLIREGQLQLHTKMRSNDARLGLTYDAFQFTQLQLTVARVLGIDAGPYFHHATSFHIYERDVEASRTLTPAKVGPPEDRPLGLPYHSIEANIHCAKQLLKGNTFDDTQWFNKVLEPLFT